MRPGRLPAPIVDAALVIAAVLDAMLMADPDRPYAVLCATVAALALAVRRRWPYLVFALTLPATVVSAAVVAGAVAVYTVAANTRNRRTLAVCAIIYSICTAATVWHQDLPAATRVDLLVSVGYNIVTAAAAMFLGQLVQARRDLQQRLTEIHQAREHEQQLVAQTVLARERAQLAREMHDVVSHQVSLITIQAGPSRSTRTTRTPGQPHRPSATSASAPWTSCGTWSPSCVPPAARPPNSPRSRRPSPASAR